MPPRISALRVPSIFKTNVSPSTRRTLIAAPKPGSGPLMTRRSDRELPDVNTTRYRPLRTIPLFVLLVAGSTIAIFNYQKSNSSAVNSTLYALRTSDEARRVLGDEIYFASRIPYIWGTIDQLHGHIDIQFSVKGTREKALMKFKSVRKSRMGMFDTLEWSLTMPDGQVINLLQSAGGDPFRRLSDDDDEVYA